MRGKSLARNALLAWASVVVMLIMVACGAARPPASGSPRAGSSGLSPADNPYLAKSGEAPTRVKAAWCAVSAGFAQLFVARDAELFTKYGLDVQATLIQGSDAALAALQAGDIDFLYCAASATIPGMATGIDATLVAAPLIGLPYVLVARKGINSVQDLKGKSMGISRAGDLDDRLSRAILKQEGLTDRDVVLRPAGGQTDRYKALLAGVVDAVTVTPPLEVQAKKDGLNVIYYLNKLPIPFIYSAMHTNSKMVRERPEVVQRFVAAMAEAVYFMEANKVEAERSISRQLKIDDPESLESAYQAYAKDIVNRSVVVPLGAVQDGIDYARQQGTRIKRGEAKDLVDNRFADDLRKSGFLEKMWGRPIAPPEASPARSAP